MSVQAATTPVPSPMAVAAVVSSIIPERTLMVRISDEASGFERRAWKEAFLRLKSSAERGWRNADPTVWASTDKAYKVASATADLSVFNGLLRFQFSDYEAFLQLVGQPNLTALVMIDRSSQRFMSVKFRHAR
jgi:hypothetical protein